MEKPKPLSYEICLRNNFHILKCKYDSPYPSLRGKCFINTHTLSRVNFLARSLPIPFYVYFISFYDSLSCNRNPWFTRKCENISHHFGGTLNENGVVGTLQRCTDITGATAAFY